MTAASLVELPGAAAAVAAAGGRVWCTAGGRLLAFGESGDRQLDVPLPEGATALAAAARWLVAVLPSGSLAWIDAQTGAVENTQSAGPSVELVQGGNAVWAIDRPGGRAWRADEPGAARSMQPVPGIDRAAADGDRLWWTSTRDTLLRDGTRTVDLGEAAREGRGALAVCAGSVWLGVPGGLIRVGTWAAQRGPLIPLPSAPSASSASSAPSAPSAPSASSAAFLVCGSGILVGAAARDRVFVLDPSADADLRAIDIDTGGPVGALAVAGRTVWIFPRDRSEARLIPV